MKKKNKKEINNEKKTREIMREQIPEDIRILFGKFYLFSIAYVFFFAFAFPFFLMYYISWVSKILTIVFLSCFYIYILIDVHKKRKRFTSSIYIFLIVLVIVSISFSIIKLFI